MSNLRITPSELSSQSKRLYQLKDKLQDILERTTNAINVLDDAMSAGFTSGMAQKGKKLCSNLKTLRNSLNTGAQVAQKCAESYENADKVLRDVIGDTLPDDIKNSPVSSQKVLRTDFDKLKVERPGSSGPCNMAATANLINRKRYMEGSSEYVTYKDIMKLNNGTDYAYWTGAMKNGIKKNYGLTMKYENSKKQIRDINYITSLCQQHPEGILVYSGGNGPHGVVLSIRDGEFYLTDSADGKYTKYADSWMARKNGLETVEELLSKAYNIYYIS